MIVVRPSENSDALYISTRLRIPDLRELRAVGMTNARMAIEGLIRSCFPNIYTMDWKGEPFAIAGVMSRPGSPMAMIGGMATATIATIAKNKADARELREANRTLLRRFHTDTGCARFFSACDVRNRAHRRWMLRLGFKEEGIDPRYGSEERPFYMFLHEGIVVPKLAIVSA